MATSGSKSVAVTSWDTLKFSWTLTGQSVANNTSTIKWTAELISGSDGALNATAEKHYQIIISDAFGEVVNKIAGNYVNIGNNATKTLASGTVTIRHKADGSGTFSYNYEQGFMLTFDGKFITAVDISGSGTLPAIVKDPSTLTVSAGTLGQSQTLTITRKDSTFKHRLMYACGDASGYVAGSASTYTTSTSITWTPPTSLANEVPDSATAIIKLTLYTYTSSGTLVGSTVSNLSCSLPANMRPMCTLSLNDITGVDDIYGSPVQGLSKIKITVGATPSYGSPIAAYTITVQGDKYNTKTATTGPLKSFGSVLVRGIAKDKRGRTGEAVYTMQVQAYTPPNVSALTVHRCDASGVEDDHGEYIHVIFSAVVSGMSGKNTAAYTIRYKKSTDTSYTELALTDLANVYSVTDYGRIIPATGDSSYNIEVVAEDRHSSVVRATSASTAFTLMNCHPAGTGLAFGKVAERANAIEFGLRMYDEYGARIGNGLAAYGGTSNPIDADTTMEHLCLTTVGTPTTDFWFVETLFYSTKSGNRAQIATPYNKLLPRKYRYRTGGVWTEWSTGSGIVLWDDFWHMIDTHVITLPLSISSMPAGIVLTFSPYDGATAQNSNYQHFFVEKGFVAANPGAGHEFNLFRYPFAAAGSKYLYISDKSITGHKNNTAAGTGASGITYDNSAWVLRRVVGV